MRLHFPDINGTNIEFSIKTKMTFSQGQNQCFIQTFKSQANLECLMYLWTPQVDLDGSSGRVLLTGLWGLLGWFPGRVL